MTRVEYDDGTVLWRRSLLAKVSWGVGVGAWIAVAGLGSGVEPGERVVFLLLGGLAAVFVWATVWRPHLAATRDGLVVRRANSAVLIPWSDVAEVRVVATYGVQIGVRAGRPVQSVVPRRGALLWFLNLESEADEAAHFMNERASSHHEPTTHPAVVAAPERGPVAAARVPTTTRARRRLTPGHRRLIALAVLVLSVTAGGPIISQLNRIDASFEELRQTGVAVPARVVNVRAAGRSAEWSVEYTHAGTTYRGKIPCSAHCFERGEQIVIFVDPQTPTRFLTDSGRASASSSQLLVAALTVVGLAALLAAGYLVRQWIIRLPYPGPTRRPRPEADWRAKLTALLGVLLVVVGLALRWMPLAFAGFAIMMGALLVDRFFPARQRDEQ